MRAREGARPAGQHTLHMSRLSVRVRNVESRLTVHDVAVWWGWRARQTTRGQPAERHRVAVGQQAQGGGKQMCEDGWGTAGRPRG